MLDGVAERHALFREHLEAIDAKYDCFAEIRGLGLLMGAEFNARFGEAGRDTLAAGIDEGVMLLVAGPGVLRFAPSLIIPEADIVEGMARLERAIARVAASVG